MAEPDHLRSREWRALRLIDPMHVGRRVESEHGTMRDLLNGILSLNGVDLET